MPVDILKDQGIDPPNQGVTSPFGLPPPSELAPKRKPVDILKDQGIDPKTYQPPKPPEQQPGLLREAAGTTVGPVAEGLLNIGPAFANMADAATGGLVNRGYQKLQKAIAEALPETEAEKQYGGYTLPESEAPTFAEGVGRTREAIRNAPYIGETPRLKAQREELAQAKGFKEPIGVLLSNPQLLAAEGLGALAYMLPIVAAGQVAGLPGVVGANVAISGGTSGLAAQEQFLKMPEKELRDTSPRYRELRKTLGDREARLQLINDINQVTAATAGALGGGATLLTGGGAPGAFIGQSASALAKAGIISPKVAQSAIGRIAEGAVREGVEETLQSGGERFGENVGARQYSPNQPLGQGVPEAMGIGLTLGAATGGAFGGLMPGRAEAPAPEQAPEQPPTGLDEATIQAARRRTDPLNPTNYAKKPEEGFKTGDTVVFADQDGYETYEVAGQRGNRIGLLDEAGNPFSVDADTLLKVNTADLEKARATTPRPPRFGGLLGSDIIEGELADPALGYADRGGLLGLPGPGVPPQGPREAGQVDFRRRPTPAGPGLTGRTSRPLEGEFIPKGVNSRGEIVRKTDGKPFPNEETANRARKSRRDIPQIEQYQPKKVKGGYVLALPPPAPLPEVRPGTGQDVLSTPEPRPESEASLVSREEGRESSQTPQFQPTHRLPDNTLVRPNTDESGKAIPNEWVDAQGTIYEDDNAEQLDAETLRENAGQVQGTGIAGQAGQAEGGQNIQQPPSEKPGDTEKTQVTEEGESTLADQQGAPLQTQEVPVSRLKLSRDVPQFKAGADEAGIVQPLEGKYDRLGTAPILVWERENGDMEVISGRHRYDLARRTGEETIPAQVVREADGFTKDDAMVADAELNIRDEQGEVQDYANYFKARGLSQKEAESRGLLSRAKGRDGFAIASQGSDTLFQLHQAGQITDKQAAEIARAAPNDERLQSLGVDALNKGKSIAIATGMMDAVKAMESQGIKTQTEQGDIFGFDDSALKQAEELSKKAQAKKQEIRDQINAVRGAAKRPEQARKLGVDVKDPKAIQAKIKELEAEAAKWDNWPTNPALRAELMGEASQDRTKPVRNEEEKTPYAKYWGPIRDQRRKEARSEIDDALTELGNGNLETGIQRLRRANVLQENETVNEYIDRLDKKKSKYDPINRTRKTTGTGIQFLSQKNVFGKEGEELRKSLLGYIRNQRKGWEKYTGESQDVISRETKNAEGATKSEAEPILTSYTEEEIAKREAEKEAAEKAEEEARKKAESKAKADQERGEFELTGSNRPADRFGSRQADVFDTKTGKGISEGVKPDKDAFYRSLERKGLARHEDTTYKVVQSDTGSFVIEKTKDGTRTTIGSPLDNWSMEQARDRALEEAFPSAETEQKESLIETLASFVDERGNLTRGGDYIRGQLRNVSNEELEEALKWARKPSQSRMVARFVGDEIAAELRVRKAKTEAPATIADQLASLSEDDLSSLIDDVASEKPVAETEKPRSQRTPKAQNKAGQTKRRPTRSKAESADLSDKSDVKRTAGEIAKSMGVNLSSAGNNAVQGLVELFGGKGKLNSGLSFDENTYAKAKPHFDAMLRDFQAAGKDLRDFIRAILDNFGTGVKPYILRYAEELRNAQRPNAGLEPDSPRGTDTGPTTQELDVDERRGANQAPGSGRETPGETGVPPEGDSGVSGRRTAVSGIQGHPNVVVQPDFDAATQFESIVTGTEQPGRSVVTDDQGIPSRQAGNETAEDVADRADKDLEARIEKQKAAEKTPIKPGELDNIRETLPVLLPLQQEDVYFAEQRLFVNNKPGVMFTNGTGTGKTLSGLGIIKRFVRQGKDNIIIVVPGDKIATDWAAAAKWLQLDVKSLKDTKDNGSRGIVVTTYANFYQNNSLMDRNWDLAVFDESHKLSQDKDGSMTQSVDMMRVLTGHPKGARKRAEYEFADERAALDKKINDYIDTIKHEHETLRSATVAANIKYADEQRRLFQRIDERAKAIESGTAERKKVLFLSATPFAYVESTEYAEGYLYDYPPENQATIGSYRHINPRSEFFINHFGYRIRYGKLTKPAAEVNQGLMQRNFNQWLKDQGALSGRQLEVDADYSRQFVLVEDAIGFKIDEGFDYIWNDRTPDGSRTYNDLIPILQERFNYLERLKLLEAIKAKQAIDRIKKHLDLGRKVVVFHNYNVGGAIHPFRFPTEGNTEAAKQAAHFRDSRPDLWNLNLTKLRSPIDTFKAAFPDALFANGRVPKAQVLRNYDKFNSDDGQHNLLVVQIDKGKEGVSLHDRTGKFQRVEINLGLPIKPTDSIQAEGRIYRVGQVSNAVFEYFNTGTNYERYAFATAIANRSSTAENLALGTNARDLMNAFVEGFSDASTTNPSAEQGTGGKIRDRQRQELSLFDQAIAYYFGRQKVSARRDQRQGVDYFSTPEPLGLKMVEWANARPNERLLEPSAGHGAIARFFPEDTRNVYIEPSMELGSQLSLVARNGKVESGLFENHHKVNKYDAIVMNPPFGQGGKTAIEHLGKAVEHLREGGRVVALIPTGPAADKRFDKWYESVEGTYLRADITLPAVTFERAGTQVATRIVVLDKVSADMALDSVKREIDATDINDLFARIRNMDIPERVIVAKNAKGETIETPIDRPVPTDLSGFGLTLQENRTPKGKTVWEISGDTFRHKDTIKELGGRWYGPKKVWTFYEESPESALLDKLLAQYREEHGTKYSRAQTEPSLPRYSLARDQSVYNADALRADLEATFGKGIVNRLSQKGRVTLLDAAPQGHPSDAAGITFDDGTIALIASNIPKGKASDVLLHEAVHAGLRQAIGDKAFLKAILDVNSRAIAGSNPALARARKRALESFEGKPDPLAVAEETIAYLIEETGARQPVVRRIIARIRHYLRQLGLVKEYTNADLVDMAWFALKRMAREEGISLPDGRAAYALPLNPPEAFEPVPQELSAFNRWFRGSQVIDESGQPKRVYHGSKTGTITEFDPYKVDNAALFGPGFYFTESPEVASEYTDKGARQVKHTFTRDNEMDAKRLAADLKRRTGATANVEKTGRQWTIRVQQYMPEHEGTVYPLYLAIKNPFPIEGTLSAEQVAELENVAKLKIEAREGEAVYDAIASKLGKVATRAVLMKAGYDGITHTGGLRLGKQMGIGSRVHQVWIAFKPGQVKSATGNVGTFDAANPDIRYSRLPPTGNAQLDGFYERAGLNGQPTVAEKLANLWNLDRTQKKQAAKQAGRETVKGVFDRFNYVKTLLADRGMNPLDAVRSGYVKLRMSTNLGSIMHALLLKSSVQVNHEGILIPKGTQGFIDAIKPAMQTPEMFREFLAYRAAKRANRLMGVKKERNFTQDQINAVMAHVNSDPAKKQLFDKTWRDVDRFMNDVLNVAVTMGLIDDQTKRIWQQYGDYIPFFRALEETIIGPTGGKGFSHQGASKRLRGGESATNDLFQNMIMNLSHLMEASLKNQAIAQVHRNVPDLFTKLGPQFQKARIPRSEIRKFLKEDPEFAQFWQQFQIDESAIDALPPEVWDGIQKMWAMKPPVGDDVVRIMENGKPVYYRVEDAELVEMLTHLNTNNIGDWIKPFQFAKRVLTAGATATPTFWGGNLTRDIILAKMIYPDLTFKEIFKGVRQSLLDSGKAVDMAIAAGSFQGGYMNANDPGEMQRTINSTLRQAGVKTATESKGYVFDWTMQAWDKYMQIGFRVENAVREAVFEHVLAKTGSTAQAAFEARDLMDYGLQGKATAIQILTRMIPFLNARMQGLSKLSRAHRADKRVAVRGVMLALVSAALLALNKDDERYKALEEWEKNTYWHIFFPEDIGIPQELIHIKIPKTFEFGALYGTVLGERLPLAFINAAGGEGDRPDQTQKALWSVLRDTLAIDWRPQLIRPVLEVQANYSSFFRRPIEGMADEGKLPSARYNAFTSPTMKALGQVVSDQTGLSPKELEHLWRGYTGTLGMYALTISDWMTRLATNEPLPPASQIGDFPLMRAFLQTSSRHTRYQSEFYDMRQDLEKTYRTIRAYQQEQRTDEAFKLWQESREKLQYRPMVNAASRQILDIRKQMDRVYRSRLPRGEKREQINALQDMINVIAKRVSGVAAETVL